MLLRRVEEYSWLDDCSYPSILSFKEHWWIEPMFLQHEEVGNSSPSCLFFSNFHKAPPFWYSTILLQTLVVEADAISFVTECCGTQIPAGTLELDEYSVKILVQLVSDLSLFSIVQTGLG